MLRQCSQMIHVIDVIGVPIVAVEAKLFEQCFRKARKFSLIFIISQRDSQAMSKKPYLVQN